MRNLTNMECDVVSGGDDNGLQDWVLPSSTVNPNDNPTGPSTPAPYDPNAALNGESPFTSIS